MSLIAGEILDQPNAWPRAAAVARSTAAALPAGERIAVIGCGSSWHAAKVIAALREQAGHGETDAFAASETCLDRSYDRVVAISRSGATTEIRRALERVSPGTATVALVGDPLSPVAAGSDHVVDLSFADDRSVVQTRFVTTAVCLARAWLGPRLEGLLADARAAMSEPFPDTADHVVVLGRGWRVGLADAGALVLGEAAQVRAEALSGDGVPARPDGDRRPGDGRSGSSTSRPPGFPSELAATGASGGRREARSARRAGPDPAPRRRDGRASRPRPRPAAEPRARRGADDRARVTVRRAQRLDGILAQLASTGSVSVQRARPSPRRVPATVRRDLQLLEDQKLLSRSHGGAVRNGVLYELPVRYRGGRQAAGEGPDRRRRRGADRRRPDGRPHRRHDDTEVARRLRERS